ncbi:transporter [Blastopirellula retiformator]|nr:transporter [Blastopirellula retiformator]
MTRACVTCRRRSWSAGRLPAALLAIAFAAMGMASAAEAQWDYRAPERLHQDEPLFVHDSSLVWKYGNGTIMPVTALQDDAAPLPPPPIPMTPESGKVELVKPLVSQEQEYGEPLEDFNVQFLRTASVLLTPGQWQMDVGLVYAKADYDFPIEVSPSGVARADLKRRSLFVPFALRYGLSDRVQLSGSLPVGWASQEFSSVGRFDQTSDNGGIGDLELGVNLLCREGCYGYSPDVILSFGLTAPTGDAEYAVNGLTQATLANGVWAPSAQLLFIQRYDPIIYFYGLGYRYQAEREFDNQNVFYGHQFTYNLGVGFAVNDRITLSASFLGLFQTETQINGLGVPGSMRELLRLRFAATNYRCGRIVEPFAEIGMTEDAADSVIGVVWTY